MTRPLPPLDPSTSAEAAAVIAVARRAGELGGRALLVGGFVRDAVLASLGRGRPGKDLDVEVFGLPLETLRGALATLGPVDTIGASFAVLRVRGLDVDFSLPRRDTKDGEGHRGFLVAADPFMSIADAARRRDFTINSISLDPLTGELLDPVGGVDDLTRGVLRATDATTFGDDPLRALRAVQMAARFALRPAPDLPALMAAQELDSLPSERLEQELRKLVLRGVRPSLGLALLRDGGCVPALPGLDAAPSTWARRDAALDRWVAERPEAAELALPEGWALLTLGATEADREALLDRVRPPVAVQDVVRALSRPWSLPSTPADARRLARALAPVPLASWLRIRAADLGEPLTATRALAERTGVLDGAPPDVVLGRHLLARGEVPGPHLGALLARCREVQDELGLTDPDEVLRRVLDDR